MTNNTICAIASSPGVGAIATIRLSGENAITIAEKVFKSPKTDKKLSKQKANTIHYGTIHANNKEIDDVIVAIFKAPHSFTGENTVEISCHGSIFIQQQILQVLIDAGAEAAKPGEFTQRAFFNGKMDLSQAEAVADLIASNSSANHKIALNQMRGGFSAEISKLRKQMLHFIAMIELELDFSEEDVEFVNRKELEKLVTEIEQIISKLVKSFKLGNALKNGIPVAIVGKTNAGKSTLLNAILNEEKAIVSEIHGTTRDVIEDVINIEGTTFRFFDTAGLRETNNKIEKIGIERSYSKIKQAEIVILVIDLTIKTKDITNNINEIKRKVADKQFIIVGNKADLVECNKLLEIMSEITLEENHNIVFISAKQKQNISELNKIILESSNVTQLDSTDVILSNVRHYEIMSQALESINRVKNGLLQGISGDFLAQDIRECMVYLGQITGDVSNDEVLGHIFKNFCIGK